MFMESVANEVLFIYFPFSYILIYVLYKFYKSFLRNFLFYNKYTQNKDLFFTEKKTNNIMLRNPCTFLYCTPYIVDLNNAMTKKPFVDKGATKYIIKLILYDVTCRHMP